MFYIIFDPCYYRYNMSKESHEQVDDTGFINEHRPYNSLSKRERQALLGVIATAFPGADSSHRLWKDFYETTTFVRRIDDGNPEWTPDNLVGSAVVTSHRFPPNDYLVYIAIDDALRDKTGLFGPKIRPHHGTNLLLYSYDVMRERALGLRDGRSLKIDTSGVRKLSFYLNAFADPALRLAYDNENKIVSVEYPEKSSI